MVTDVRSVRGDGGSPGEEVLIGIAVGQTDYPRCLSVSVCVCVLWSVERSLRRGSKTPERNSQS